MRNRLIGLKNRIIDWVKLLFAKDSVFGRYPLATGGLMLLVGVSIFTFCYFLFAGNASNVWWITAIILISIGLSFICAIVGFGVALFLSDEQATTETQ
jgi:hypothetical protein